MWLIGPINQHPACKGFIFKFQDWCIIAWLLAAMINQHLEGLGHETVLPKFRLTNSSKHKEHEQVARILLEEFLRDLAPSLMEDMDLDFDENQE